MYWFMLQMGIAYFIAYYAASDFTQYGKMLFLKTKSRGTWWLGKCIWCISLVVLYYIAVYVGIGIFARINGAEMALYITREVAVSWYGQTVLDISYIHIWLIVFILPVITTISVSLSQMFLSLIVTPVMSFAGVCGMYVLSAYYTTIYLPGNFTMWIRSRYMDSMGVESCHGMLISIIMMLLSMLVGWQYIKRKDVL